MSIPIILINRDRLQSTERLVGQLQVLGYDDITILDMASTYEPLIDWYDTNTVIKILYHENTGHKALWNDGILKEYFSQHEWVCISDSDIELSQKTPTGFVEDMICVAKDFRMNKVGLSIEYRDITNQYLKNIIDPIEGSYWHQLPHKTHKVYSAPVDTTMCVVRPQQLFTYAAVRLGDWPIKHLDWYSDWNNLTEEEQYYFDHADPKIATTLQHYTRWQQTQTRNNH